VPTGLGRPRGRPLCIRFRYSVRRVLLSGSGTNPDTCGAAKHLVRSPRRPGRATSIDVGLQLPADAAMASRHSCLSPRSASGKANLKEAFITFGDSTVRSILTALAPYRNAGHRMESFPRMPWIRCTGVRQFRGSPDHQASLRAPNNRPWSLMDLGQESRIWHRSQNESRLV
jgi:hypothetical protein